MNVHMSNKGPWGPILTRKDTSDRLAALLETDLPAETKHVIYEAMAHLREGTPLLPADEPSLFRRAALTYAAALKPSDFAGDLVPGDPNTEEGLGRAIAIIAGGDNFTVDEDGFLHGCVGGDMGYANTGIQVDIGRVWYAEDHDMIVSMFRMFLHGLNSRLKEKNQINIDDAAGVFRAELARYVDGE